MFYENFIPIMDITILGIESSCDDTSAAVIRNRTLLSNVIASQAVHQKYGGVIPELASRAHQQTSSLQLPTSHNFEMTDGAK